MLSYRCTSSSIFHSFSSFSIALLWILVFAIIFFSLPSSSSFFFWLSISTPKVWFFTVKPTTTYCTVYHIDYHQPSNQNNYKPQAPTCANLALTPCISYYWVLHSYVCCKSTSSPTRITVREGIAAMTLLGILHSSQRIPPFLVNLVEAFCWMHFA